MWQTHTAESATSIVLTEAAKGRWVWEIYHTLTNTHAKAFPGVQKHFVSLHCTYSDVSKLCLGSWRCSHTPRRMTSQLLSYLLTQHLINDILLKALNTSICSRGDIIYWAMGFFYKNVKCQYIKWVLLEGMDNGKAICLC